MANVHTIQLPLVLLLPVGGVLLAWIVALRLIRASRSRRPSAGAEPEKDWSIPAIDSPALADSPFHRWDPRIKLASLLLFIFCVASVTQLVPALCALLFAIASVLGARIPLSAPMRRLRAMSGFLGMLLVVMSLTAPPHSGDTLVHFEHVSFLPLNTRGFLVSLVICLKAAAIAMLVEPLMATSPLSTTVQALARLRVPSMVCQMILLSHRYIHVFQDEASRMNRGMSARGFRARTDMETLRTIGNFLGMLLVRSFERTRRVHGAMLARGYSGEVRMTARFNAKSADWAKGAFWALAGSLLVAVDRIWNLPGF